MKFLLFLILCIIPSSLAFAESTHVGKVYWMQEIVSQNSFADIMIEDDDMNKKEYPNFADKLTIHVWSDSSPDGLDVVAVENGVYSGIFKASVYISDTDSDGVKLYSKKGDVLYAKYVDTTVSGTPVDIISASIVKIPQQDMTQYLDKINPQFLQKQNTIPSWVKNNAGWWADGTISESEFIQGIQFLIKDGIIVIPPTTVSADKSQSVPDWVKNNAGWWADGTISDGEFVNGIQHLIKTGIISIPAESKTSDSSSTSKPSTKTSSDSKLASLEAELEKCAEIVKPYPRLNCEREVKMKITEYEHEQNSVKYLVGDVTFYFPGSKYEVTPAGQALLTIDMLAKNTGSSNNVSLMCTGPSVCNYDVWNGEKAFKYSATDFTSGNIVLTPGQSREFSILFGHLIPYGGTQFIYDPTKEYVFRISEPWGSLMIPLNLP